ncbi:possible cytochrome c alcohol dehydrogenase subunit [Psychrobacter arcticus 273-4]|uniref:Possible cytochrome c alcohol dehydrogenase subunit n=1 Tax=Psychrobacter arcticus (strain DSM 17307 / VKM B-2377 / 273-4) TaxID=259536 RepID=Q4FSK6_PSYA2|nr:cytochrome c [Psychrobacter arcticus]AAZ19002.1 possible cytochrome c alcohol dehydrogenase subunit [Psychrobacter arcticus 273-4]
MKPTGIVLSATLLSIASSAVMADSARSPHVTSLLNISPATSLLNVSPMNSDLANRGAYIARTADCMACHREDYSGGIAIETPTGNIYSTNITPSQRYGIGNYTEIYFKKALQKGRAPTHQLYPAMPYPSYHGMADADISALFAYFQTVPPIEMPPEKTTHLPFPLNIRTLMLAWNVINVPSTKNRAGLTQTQQRGEYLVNNLEHCGTCHTPRNLTQGLDKEKYLSGAPLGKWYAPNITPDNDSGIGRWSEGDIVTYLRSGLLDKRAYAGGPMAEAIAHSTRYLSDEDLIAMASYLKVVPIIKTDDYLLPVDMSRLPNPLSSSITYNLIEQKDYLAQEKSATNAGSNTNNSPKALYLAACASCHGVDGYAQPDARYASIVGLSSIRRVKPDALINVIAYGAKGALNTAPKMPGFDKELSHAQIASITNYVRVNFGGLPSSNVSAADVKRILK